MSDMDDLDSFDNLKEKYGDEFLFLREGDNRYVIRDRGLMERAQRAVKPVNDAGRELGESVTLQAQEALGNSKDARSWQWSIWRAGRCVPTFPPVLWSPNEC